MARDSKGNADASPEQPQANVVFCPDCMKRVRVPASVPKGKMVRCPKCKQPFDPFSGTAMGTDRMRIQKNLAEESPGWPEWAWALIIGGGNGVIIGGVLGIFFGLFHGSQNAMFGQGSVAASTAYWLVVCIGFYTFAGCFIGLAMVFTGGSIAGYLLGCVFAVPAASIFGLDWGVIGTLVFTVLIERVIDYKLYSGS